MCEFKKHILFPTEHSLFFNVNIGFVLQALHHRLETTVKSQVEVMEQLEKMKDENDDLKFQVCACLNYLIIISNHCTALIPTCFRNETNVQGGSNMTGTDLCVNKPHCAAAVRP